MAERTLTDEHKAKIQRKKQSGPKALVLQAKPVKGTKKLIAGLHWLTELGVTEHKLSAVVLRQHLCSESTPAGALLRTCLVKTSGYAPGVKYTAYVVDPERLMDLRQRYGLDDKLPAVLTSARTKLRYLATVKMNPFNAGIPRTSGKRVGRRYYTEVTTMEEEVRTALIGHGFDYDITASMATLLYQKYIKAGGSKPLSTWQSLVLDRTAFRQTLVDFTGLPMAKVKTIIAGVLNGAQLVRYRENSIWNIFREAHAKVTWDEFIAHPLLVGLVEDGRVLYDTLVPSAARTREMKILKDGREMLRAKSRGWHQYQIYEEVEDEVMAVVSVVLGDEDVWYIHDGFMRRDKISREKFRALIDEVRAQTGYEIELEETELRAEPEEERNGRPREE